MLLCIEFRGHFDRSANFYSKNSNNSKPMNIYAILCLNAQVIQMKKQKNEREKLYEKKKENTYKLVDVVMSLASKPGDMMSGVITNTYTNHD